MKILIIDDEPYIASILKLSLENMGHICEYYNDVTSIIKDKKKINEFDLFFIDVIMPSMLGQDVLKNILSIKQNAKVIMMSGFISKKDKESFQKQGAFDFLEKPFKIEQIQNIMKSVATAN